MFFILIFIIGFVNGQTTAVPTTAKVKLVRKFTCKLETQAQVFGAQNKWKEDILTYFQMSYAKKHIMDSTKQLSKNRASVQKKDKNGHQKFKDGDGWLVCRNGTGERKVPFKLNCSKNRKNWGEVTLTDVWTNKIVTQKEFEAYTIGSVKTVNFVPLPNWAQPVGPQSSGAQGAPWCDKTTDSCEESVPHSNPPNTVQAITRGPKKWFQCKTGYAPRENTALRCANDRKWYLESDWKRTNPLTDFHIQDKLQCITCTYSWENIRSWFEQGGKYANEVIVEGGYLDHERSPARPFKTIKGVLTYDDKEKYNPIVQYVTFHCPTTSSGKGFLSFNYKTFRSPPINLTPQREKKRLNCRCNKKLDRCAWYRGVNMIERNGALQQFFDNLKCSIEGGYAQFGVFPFAG